MGEGDWICDDDSCGNINFAFRTKCNRCEKDRGDNPNVINKEPFSRSSSSGRQWECPNCKNFNFSHRIKCNRCEMDKPGLEESSNGDNKGADGNWQCENCKNINFAYRTRCNRCDLGKGEVPVNKKLGDEVRLFLIGICDEEIGDEENWECKHCNNINPIDRAKCIRCSKDKKESLKRKHGLAIGKTVAEKSEGFFSSEDWQCNCGNINIHTRGKCNLCELGRKHGQPVGEIAAKKSRGLFSAEDWQCNCTNVNFATRSKCNRCDLDRSSGIVKKRHGQELGEFLASKSRGLFTAEDWQCDCGSINFASVSECRRCARGKNDKPANKNRSHGHEIGEDVASKSRGLFHAIDWQCSCGNINFAIRTKCNVCELDRRHGQEIGEEMASKSRGLFSAEDWHCNCGNINFASRNKCKRCGLGRSEGTVRGAHGHAIGDLLAKNSRGLFSADDWQCQCGNINFANRTKCNRCDEDRGYRAFSGMENDVPMSMMPQKMMFSGDDWRCSCGNVNFANRNKCNRCDLDKQRGMEIGPQGGGRNPMMFGPNDWKCSCGNLNFAARRKCNRCDMDREHLMGGGIGMGMGMHSMPPRISQPNPGMDKGGPFSNMRDPENWRCSKCSNLNFKHRVKCNRCGSDKEESPIKRKLDEPNNWICLLCSNVNWAHRVKCNKCGVDKGENQDSTSSKKMRMSEIYADT